ncbi:MAG: hypothetical protein EPO35_11300 [Acidobacteria bacterium]|nr:MAG: hypothetical protein EPO35_11300 [Acidobacteriota bacterium]
MKVQFYHAIALSALVASACGRPATSNGPGSEPPVARAQPGAAIPSAPAPPSTPTAEAIEAGRALIERVRAAAGGAKVTAMRRFQATGTSRMSVVPGTRTFTVRALFPGFYRQEEIPTATGGFGFAVGVEAEDIGWMLGGRLGGEGRSSDPKVARAAYDRAGSQAMAGVLAGVNAPWLVDSGKFTPIAAGKVEGGDDRDLAIVNLEGPTGRAGRLLIDPGTFLPRRFIEPPQTGVGGEAGLYDLVFTYSDFKDVQGVQLPHTIVRRVGNIQTTWSIANYDLAPKLKPADFTRRMAARAK